VVRAVVRNLTYFFFGIFFLVLNTNINLSDDVLKEKKIIRRPNGEHWYMENVENFSCKSRFFLVLVLFWSFVVIFGLNTEFVPEFSAVYHLFHMKLKE
jgi:hypothetical protein